MPPESERIQYKSLAVSEQEAKQIITGAVAFAAAAECIKIHNHTHTREHSRTHKRRDAPKQ